MTVLNRTRRGVSIRELCEERTLHETETAPYSPPPAFGHFRVLHQVGAGAMGPVFRGHDPEHGRLVAIKVFRLGSVPEKAGELAAELGRLIDVDFLNPGLIALYAAGVEEPVVYLAEEYVSADSLDAALRQYGPAPFPQALGLLGQLASALDFAAALDVFHGALHPRDILVSPDDTRLTGIGIAAALERCGIPAPVRRPYTAPERLEGTPPSREADVFSLAVCAHELLTGRRPLPVDDRLVARLDGLEADQDELALVFGRALAVGPADRFTSASEFVAALQAILQKPVPEAAEPGASGLKEEPGVIPVGATEWSVPDIEETRGPGPDDEVDVAEPDLAFAEPDGGAVRKGGKRGGGVGDAGLLPFDVDDTDPLAAEPPRADGPGEPWDEVGLDAAREGAVPGVEAVDVVWADEEGPRPDTRVTDLEWEGGDERPGARIDEAIVGLPERDAGAAGRAVRGRAAGLPWLLVLLVGLFVGFVAGYVVGISRAVPDETARATALPAAAPTPDSVGIAGPGVEGPPATQVPSATAGRLEVRTTPAGVRVRLNGIERGWTPITISDLPAGRHALRLALSGYETDERQVTLAPGQAVQRVAVTMRRPARPAADRPVAARPAAAPTEFVGSMLVESRPSGARVLLDGSLAGTTPLTLPRVPAGSHVVRLELDGYRPWSASVQVTAGQRAIVRGSLELELPR